MEFLIIVLFYWLFALWINMRAQPLIDEIQKVPELYKSAGSPSDTYFCVEFIMLNYSFALFLLRNKSQPIEISHVEDYDHIRKLAVFLLFLDIVRGFIIIMTVLFHQKLNHFFN